MHEALLTKGPPALHQEVEAGLRRAKYERTPANPTGADAANGPLMRRGSPGTTTTPAQVPTGPILNLGQGKKGHRGNEGLDDARGLRDLGHEPHECDPVGSVLRRDHLRGQRPLLDVLDRPPVIAPRRRVVCQGRRKVGVVTERCEPQRRDLRRTRQVPRLPSEPVAWSPEGTITGIGLIRPVVETRRPRRSWQRRHR